MNEWLYILFDFTIVVILYFINKRFISNNIIVEGVVISYVPGDESAQYPVIRTKDPVTNKYIIKTLRWSEFFPYKNNKRKLLLYKCFGKVTFTNIRYTYNSIGFVFVFSLLGIFFVIKDEPDVFWNLPVFFWVNVLLLVFNLKKLICRYTQD